MTWMSDMEQRVLNVEKAVQHLGDLYEGMKAELDEIDPPVTFKLEDPIPVPMQCSKGTCKENAETLRKAREAIIPIRSDNDGEDVLDRVGAVLGVALERRREGRSQGSGR